MIQNDDPDLYSKTGVVYRHIHRPSKEAVQAIAASPAADVHEAMGDVLGYRMTMRPGMRPIRPNQRACGPAVTAFQYPGDNLMMLLALKLTQPGDVIVVNSFWSYAPQWGSNAASWATAHGVVGLVADGAVRDNEEVARIGFPVWSTTVAFGKNNKGAGAGAVNIPIACGGVIVNPGDIVVADDDGVVVVPRQIADTIADACRKKTAYEDARRAQFAKSGSTPATDLYTEHYKRFGMRDVDRAWGEP